MDTDPKQEQGKTEDILVVDVGEKVEPPKVEKAEPPKAEPKTYDEKAYQGLQRVIADKDKEIKRLKAEGQSTTDLREQVKYLRELAEITADAVIKGEEETAPENTLIRRRKELLAKSQTTPQRTMSPEESEAISGIRVILKRNKINPDDPKVVSYLTSNYSGPVDALEAIDEIIPQLQNPTSKNTVDVEAIIQKANAPLLAKIAELEKKMKTEGLDAVETGVPSGSGELSEDQLDKLSMAEYARERNKQEENRTRPKKR